MKWPSHWTMFSHCWVYRCVVILWTCPIEQPMPENCLSTYLVCHLEKLMTNLAWSGVLQFDCNGSDRTLSCHECRSRQTIQCTARAYMLYLAGCTLFSDKSGTWVSTDYLKLFEDLGQVLAFAWGCYISIHVHAVTVCFKRWSEAGWWISTTFRGIFKTFTRLSKYFTWI